MMQHQQFCIVIRYPSITTCSFNQYNYYKDIIRSKISPYVLA
jgi:hypothetical protein